MVELAPLSESAVASLAGDGADELYAATGGNPFYVTELLASRTSTELPPSVANAVVGRASRLDDDARRLLKLVSVVPSRVHNSVLDVVMPGWEAAAEEPERRALLEVHPRYVRFRHELARNAIRSSIPIAARRGLNAEILQALLAANADPADIVHHAEAAGAENVVADYALVAARRAAALDSNREAYSHYRRASVFLDRLSAPERAAVLEELASAAYAVYRLDDAFDAIERAIAEWTALGDGAAVGRCTQILSRFHWHAGDGDAARAKALEAIEILEPLGESVELARAYSGLSQLKNLAEYNDQALLWGERALELATKLGDERTRAHVLVNIASVRLDVDHRQVEPLLEAHGFADEAGDKHEATRALVNLAYALMSWAQPEPAMRYARQALAYAEQNEVYNLASYIAVTHAWLQLRAGDWDEAERVTRAELEKSVSVAQLVAKTVLAELAVRRGDPDAAERLADLAAQAVRASEPQRLAPLVELETEWALTTGAPLPLELLETLLDEERPPGALVGWGAVRVAACAAVAGLPVELEPPSSAPYAAMLRRDWLGAADAFGEVGWSYDRALMLSLLDGEDPLHEAIGIARGLGADPLTHRVAERMRERGIRVPQGPRESTRENPAGLTARQLEVLALAGRGADERGDRRAARRLAADRRAPRCRGADEARRRDAPGRCPARRGARAGRPSGFYLRDPGRLNRPPSAARCAVSLSRRSSSRRCSRPYRGLRSSSPPWPRCIRPGQVRDRPWSRSAGCRSCRQGGRRPGRRPSRRRTAAARGSRWHRRWRGSRPDRRPCCRLWPARSARRSES